MSAVGRTCITTDNISKSPNLPDTKKGSFDPSSAASLSRLLCSVFEVSHAEPDPALAIDFQHFDFDDVTLAQLVADFLNALVRDLRDVNQSVLPRQDRHESTKVHEARNTTFVDAADFDGIVRK